MEKTNEDDHPEMSGQRAESACWAKRGLSLCRKTALPFSPAEKWTDRWAWKSLYLQKRQMPTETKEGQGTVMARKKGEKHKQVTRARPEQLSPDTNKQLPGHRDSGRRQEGNTGSSR